jgi:uncharacterized membrane protein YedE/YeeE
MTSIGVADQRICHQPSRPEGAVCSTIWEIVQMSGFKKALVLALSATMMSAAAAQAADWWPFKIASAKDGDVKNVQEIEYTPLEKAE